MNTEKNILVSVIIPVYNAGKFLTETIESVLSQSLVDFQLILVNDGSTDNSAFICEDYVKKEERIQYFIQKNSGVSVARNLGLSYACGEYVFFLDSDDTLDSEFLKTSYNAAKKQNTDITIIGKQFCERLPNVAALPTCAQFLRLDFLKENSVIRFPKDIQPCEDGLFSHQLIALTQNIGTNPDGIYHYRHHENQNHLKINENSEKVLQQIPIWFNILEAFYERYNLYQTHALHLALFVEHEPFEFRYIDMSFNKEQKEILYKIIKEFINKNIIGNLKKEDYLKLSIPFLYLMSCDSFSDFDVFYDNYVKRKALNKKVRMFFVKFIPFSKLRRKVRQEINQKYS